jgi:4-hydroxy-tetrahydrodipicolinate synthase
MRLQELKGKMKGVFVVLMTPFRENGDVDYEGLRVNLRYLLERAKGKDFVLTPTGSMGEFYAMSEDERRKVLETVVDEVDGELPILAGTAFAGTRQTIEMSKYAESIGYDGAQIVLPYYHTPSEEGMYQHYKAISDAVGPDFGVMVYNNPAVSGSWIKPALMTRISKLSQVIAVKENNPDIRKVKAVHDAVDPEDMQVIEGLGEPMYCFAFVFGVKGFVSSLANIAPLLCYSLYEAAMDSDLAGVRAAAERIDRLFSLRTKANRKYGPTTAIAGSRSYVDLSVVKQGLDLLGLCGGKVRGPITNIESEDVEELRTVMKDLGLPVAN